MPPIDWKKKKQSTEESRVTCLAFLRKIIIDSDGMSTTIQRLTSSIASWLEPSAYVIWAAYPVSVDLRWCKKRLCSNDEGETACSDDAGGEPVRHFSVGRNVLSV